MVLVEEGCRNMQVNEPVIKDSENKEEQKAEK